MERIRSWWAVVDTVMPHGLLMLRNCFLGFAVEHWFPCRATEPGFAGDIGAIKVWSINRFFASFKGALIKENKDLISIFVLK